MLTSSHFLCVLCALCGRKKWLALMFFVLIPLHATVQEVKVTADIDKTPAAETPFTGVVIITHDTQLPVDINSFKMDNKPLKVKFIKEVPLASDSSVVLTFYEFNMVAKPKGLYFLPEVSVSVGGKKYTSIPVSYAVKDKDASAAQPAPGQTQAAGVASPSPDKLVVLTLENIVDGDTILYPGQQIRVGYRYHYTYSFDLTKEEIPLLEAKGFEKIGGKDVKESAKKNGYVSDITQVIQAVKPGTYKFGPSLIEGRAYIQDASGQKIYDQSEKHSEAPEITLTVLPFPEEGKPPSFHGAVGDFNFTAVLDGEPKVYVGDKINLLLKFSGSGSLASISPPDLCCQPGFSGFFKQGDLPPEEKIKNDEKIFNVEMRPLSTSIKEIPSIEFSFFNPKEKKYKTVKSKPIPITVMPAVVKPSPEKNDTAHMKEETVQPNIPKVGAIEIEGNYILTQNDLKNRPFGTWWTLLIIPLGIGAILIQIQMRHYLLKQKLATKPITSQELFNNALQTPADSSRFFNLLHRAFFTRLVEKGEINSSDIPLDSLSDQGLSGKVKAFFRHIEMQRFSGKIDIPEQQIIEEAKKLFKELE